MAENGCKGLCGSCMHAATCVFIGNVKRPVYYCEEFRVERPPAAGAVRENFFQNEKVAYEKQEDDLNQGLCCDCENRNVCGLSVKPEGGVWYCEEYR